VRLWSKETPLPSISTPETRRALQLDALAAILPMDRRDRLAELLTDDDVETLKHLAREGMGEDSLRALASDLAYLETWADAATGQPLPWPATEALTLKFVAHHLWDLSKREIDPDMGCLRTSPRACGRRGCCVAMAPMPRAPSSGAWRAGAHCTAGKGSRAVRRAEPARGPALGRSRLAAAARAQEQAGRHPGRLGSVDRNLRDGLSSRYPGSRHPPLGVCVRRASAQRSGAAARRAAEG
jgi:hypothetical protein